MDFGDKSKFAVTIELDKNYNGAWLFGRICYWVAGIMVGYYDLGTSLRDVLFEMMYIPGDNGKRYCLPLFNLGKEKIFSLISGVLDETSDEIYSYIHEDFMPARFDVGIRVDVFDDWRMFLIDGDKISKFIYKKHGSTSIVENFLPVGEFDQVFNQAYTYLDNLYEEQISKNK